MNKLRVKDTGNKGLGCIGNEALALSMVAVIYIMEHGRGYQGGISVQ